MLSDRVVSVRSGNWKLYVIAPREQKSAKPDKVDPPAWARWGHDPRTL